MRALALASLLALPWQLIAAECQWPAWERYHQAMMSEDGRIIDRSSAQLITTSEGQSYAMFFALVANDRASFDKLVRWTSNNLAGGDLSQQLPAWQWGRDDEGQWRVLDSNNATDSDLWIAYSLLEAGRLWDEPGYTRLGTEMLWRTTAQSLRVVPDLGLMLLPGDRGFETSEGWRFNLSYLPPQLLQRFAQIAGVWAELATNSHQLMLLGSPKGFAPNWLHWRIGEGVHIPEDQAQGSYDAIRVYLWIGMLAPQAPGRAELLSHFQPMLEQTRSQGLPPEAVDSLSGEPQGRGPAGFSAALLPMLQALEGYDDQLNAQRERLIQHPPAEDAYYNQSLLLFGQGWDEQRYRFDEAGRLQPAWTAPCHN